ncbi:MAG: HAD hydrolase-like protein, partial [Ilumatobacteraceae bacterium]
APSRCVVVEDSPTEIAAGAAAGMHVIAYSGGRMHPANALTNAGAHDVIDSMADLPALLAAGAGTHSTTSSTGIE